MTAGFGYILASARNGTLYVGVTSALVQRIWQHRDGMADSFTRRYGCKTLVWFGSHDDLQEARLREAHIKKWKRLWKLHMIEATNPDWEDLYPTLL